MTRDHMTESCKIHCLPIYRGRHSGKAYYMSKTSFSCIAHRTSLWLACDCLATAVVLDPGTICIYLSIRPLTLGLSPVICQIMSWSTGFVSDWNYYKTGPFSKHCVQDMKSDPICQHKCAFVVRPLHAPLVLRFQGQIISQYLRLQIIP